MRWRIRIYSRSNLSFQNRRKMISVQVRPQCLQNILSNAGVRGGLPLFQCCSLDLVPSTTWLQNRELDDFLVIPNFSAAILSELCSLVSGKFVCLQLTLISTPSWITKIWQLRWWGATGEPLETEFKFLRCDCKLSFIFAPLPECTREIAITGYLFRVMYIFFSTSPVLKLVKS